MTQHLPDDSGKEINTNESSAKLLDSREKTNEKTSAGGGSASSSSSSVGNVPDVQTLQDSHKPKNLTRCLVQCTFAVTFGSSLLFGYNTAVLNTPAETILRFYNQTYAQRWGVAPNPNLLELLWSVSVAVYVGIGLIGAFCSGFVADKVGRKRGLILNHIIMFVGALLEGLTKVGHAPELLIVGRMFVGFNCGLTAGLASLYLAEIAPQKLRGAIASCHQLLCTIGILLAQVLGIEELLGNEKLWPLLLAFTGFPALIAVFLLPFCPESPRFLLLKKHNEEDARDALRRLRNSTDINNEIEEMKQEAKEAQASGTFTCCQIFQQRDLRMPLLIAVVLQVAQQWSGINAVFFYSEVIFKDAGLTVEAVQYAILGTGIINVLTTVVALPLVEKLGRRMLLIGPMIMMAISLVILIISINLQAQATWLSYLSIVCILVYVIGFAVGLGPLPGFVVAELFRQEPRPVAMSIAQCINWSCNFILALCFRFVQARCKEYTFIIFIMIIIGSVTFIFFFVPETKNRSFDEIAHEIGKPLGHRYKQRIAKDDPENNATNVDSHVMLLKNRSGKECKV
ncbi:solute carrier family 2, facilitated glucose transporter member 1-like [Tubulanus polymorphus]|uniref:solute carrier family 2, facilitated glucose transporter member 1-like n=1 Tax=Tubulanus polymorphus TaxID=672921 RepID=UPI003DA2378F